MSTTSTSRILVNPRGLRAAPLTPPVSKSDAQRALVLGHLTGAWPLPSVQAESDEDLPADVRVLRRGVEALRLPPGPVRDVDCADGGAPFRILATQVAVPIELLTVRELHRAAPLPSPVLPPLVVAGVAEDAGDELAAMLQATEDALRRQGVAASRQLLVGPVASTLAAQVKPDDLVVMSSQGRRGVPRWLLGSVAEHLVRNAPAPVLLVPPKDRALNPLVRATDADRIRPGAGPRRTTPAGRRAGRSPLTGREGMARGRPVP